MSAYAITMHGIMDDCWIISRVGNDAPPVPWQPIRDDWIDVMEICWGADYHDFSGSDVRPKVRYQFVPRCLPIPC